jgi:hypothetical protein
MTALTHWANDYTWSLLTGPITCGAVNAPSANAPLVCGLLVDPIY